MSSAAMNRLGNTEYGVCLCDISRNSIPDWQSVNKTQLSQAIDQTGCIENVCLQVVAKLSRLCSSC